MADQTSIQESAQALFCAMADFVGANEIDKIFDINKYPIYSEFKKYWNNSPKYKAAAINSTFASQVVAPGVTLKDIETLFQQDIEWYYSSVNIAKKLIKEVDSISSKFSRIKTPRWSDLLYVRGDKEIMKNIEALFKIANDTQKKINSIPGSSQKTILGDVNKWSPADIYFASTKARTAVNKALMQYKGKQMTFNVLNGLIGELIDSGDLLPLSLKKAAKSVIIEKVNFNRKDEIKKVSKYKFLGLSDWKPYKVNAPSTRDLKIYFDPDSQRTLIKIRHDASGAKFTAEVELASRTARGGSIGSVNIFATMLSVLDPAFGQKYLAAYNAGNEKYRKEVRTPEMEKLNIRNRTKFEDIRTEASAMYISNVIHPLLINWLKKDKARADTFIQMIYMYITSRSEVSGPFVIAK